MSDIIYYKLLGQVEKKKQKFLFRISMKRRTGGRFFFVVIFDFFYYFQCFLCKLLPFPRDKLEFLGQILINKMKRQMLIKHKFELL